MTSSITAMSASRGKNSMMVFKLYVFSWETRWIVDNNPQDLGNVPSGVERRENLDLRNNFFFFPHSQLSSVCIVILLYFSSMTNIPCGYVSECICGEMGLIFLNSTKKTNCIYTQSSQECFVICHRAV